MKYECIERRRRALERVRSTSDIGRYVDALTCGWPGDATKAIAFVANPVVGVRPPPAPLVGAPTKNMKILFNIIVFSLPLRGSGCGALSL